MQMFLWREVISEPKKKTRKIPLRMVANMEKWRDEWVADVKPSDEEVAKKESDIAKLLGSFWGQGRFGGS